MSRADAGRERFGSDLLDQLADIVIELETDGRISSINRAVGRIFGIDPEQIEGRSFLELVASEDRERTIAGFRKVVEAGEDLTLRFQAPRRDGLRISIEAAFRAFDRSDGRRAITAVCRDVTDHESTSRVDRLRKAQYRALVESGLHATAIARADGSIRFANRHFKSIFGGAEHIDGLLPLLRFGQRKALGDAWFESTQENASSVGAIDLELVGEPGRPHWISFRWSSFQSESGERLFAIQADDISRRKQVELAFTRLARGVELDELDELQAVIASLATALELDRLILARLDPAHPDQATRIGGWQDGRGLGPGEESLVGLPEAIAARGELCLHPAGVTRLLPEVADRLDPGFVSFAGIGLVARHERRVLGLLAGYARRPLQDPERVRGFLTSAAEPLARALEARADREAEAASRSRFEALCHLSGELVIELDGEGAIAALSGAFETLLGHTPRAWIGQPLPALFAGGPDRAALDLREQPSPIGLVLRHADGRPRGFEARIAASTDGQGLRRWLIVAREARAAPPPDLGRDLLHRVIQQSTDLVFVCDLDTTLLFANETASRHLRTAMPDVQPGRTLLDLLTPADAQRLRSEVLPRLTTSFPWSGELALNGGPEDEPTPTEATVLLFCDPVGPVETAALRSYFAVTLRDIRARRRTEEALRQSELRLGQSRKLESVGRLAGGIAHDFNNLLTAIIGYSDLVLQELDADHATRPDIEEILRAAERASGLTRQLLAFSRRQVLRPERVDLNAIVAEIDRMLRRLIGEDIELVSQLHGGLDAILADPGQVEQITVNLVVNARDAMPRGGRLEIETFNHLVRTPQRVESGVLSPGAYVALRVSDTGTGMDDATRSQIFEPFFTTKGATGGTGLGLASVYGIVSQSRGQIDVASRVGEGSTFTVYLPTAHEVLIESGPDEPSVIGRGRETVLLVEDSRPVRKLVERTLHRRGYTVLPAESATAALRHCSRHEGPIDLLLTDVVLPRMAGPEIARRAQQLRPGIRVLYMSGFTDETLTQHGLSNSGPELLEKPFSSAALLGRVRQILDEPPRGVPETTFLVEQPDEIQMVEGGFKKIVSD
ncbi:MAG: PAS domain S-box protein [Deltaproteobacteria bacterium]|nr:PAS domain S-box protein [Deltaproteobacteria bacterium]